uniref:Uncharacterized protein n=1 Tax=Alexandrium catenella TaxID=2925 RepID=A0A7S1W878_ALECA|mmetsp:Transcript_4267/g.11345  ORF Transcript_4267/g.11345 Transcript_4267/m.11345 type:complete len:304 (+) Transcript_4267:75-986(+)
MGRSQVMDLFCSSVCRRSDPCLDRVRINPARIDAGASEGKPGTAESDPAAIDAKWEESTADRSDCHKSSDIAKWDEDEPECNLDWSTSELDREPLAWERAEEVRLGVWKGAECARMEEEQLQQQMREEPQCRVEEAECARIAAQEEQLQRECAAELQAEREREQREREEELRVQREREEELRRCEEDARIAQEREQWRRKRTLRQFYKDHGFLGANQPRKGRCFVWGSGTTYPLHCAAELADVRIVTLLLQEGASASQTNSAGETAEQVARRKNKAGSHDAVLRALSGNGKPKSRFGGALGGA